MRQPSDPLAGLDEAGFRTQVLIPLLNAMGYQDVDHTHGAHELGKDIVAWSESPDGSRAYTAFVVKVGRIGASATGDAGTVATQIRQAFGSSFRSKTAADVHQASTVQVVTTGTIKQPSREAILAQVDDVQRRHVRFWDGDTVRILLTKHLPEPIVPDYTAAVHGALADLEHFDVLTRISAAGVEYEIYARHDETIVADVILAFPETPEAEFALKAMNRHIEDGDPVLIPGSFIQTFAQHEELSRIFGNATPTELHIGSATGGRSSQVAIEVQTGPIPLRYEGLAMRCVRSGTRRSRFETVAGSPLTVALVLEKRDDGQKTLKASFNLSLSGHSPADAELAVTVWAALRSGTPYRVLALPQEHPLSEGCIESVDQSPFPLRSYILDLAVIARRLGWDLRIPDQVTARDMLDAAELRSILEMASYHTPFSTYSITYRPDPDEPDPFFEVLLGSTPFWFRATTENTEYELLGRRLDLGTGESLIPIQLASGEADRVRTLLGNGTSKVRLRFDAALSRTVTHIYPLFMTEDARVHYEALSDEEPPALVGFVRSLQGALQLPDAQQLDTNVVAGREHGGSI